jgi:hypothetical protein
MYLVTLSMVASILLLMALNCKIRTRRIDRRARESHPNPTEQQSYLRYSRAISIESKWVFGNTPSQGVLAPPPPLSNLHLPLIQHIGALLPPSSAAALALCSRRLMVIIRTGYWQSATKSWEEERHALLSTSYPRI